MRQMPMLRQMNLFIILLLSRLLFCIVNIPDDILRHKVYSLGKHLKAEGIASGVSSKGIAVILMGIICTQGCSRSDPESEASMAENSDFCQASTFGIKASECNLLSIREADSVGGQDADDPLAMGELQINDPFCKNSINRYLHLLAETNLFKAVEFIQNEAPHRISSAALYATIRKMHTEWSFSDLLDWAFSHPDAERRRVLGQAVVATLPEHNLLIGGKILLERSLSPADWNWVAAVYAERVAQYDIEVALEWAESIEDPQCYLNSCSQIVAVWEDLEPGRATEWLKLHPLGKLIAETL